MKKVTLIILALISTSASLFSQCIVKISGGEANTIAHRSDGTLWFWGRGANGQSGTSNTQDHYTPIPFANSTQQITNFEAGFDTTFIIKQDGALWGTGGNNTGQLGMGTTQYGYFSPVHISPGTTWKHISSTAHTYGIRTNGTLWGWGLNDSGQMGNGSCCNNQLSSIQIGNASDWKQVESALIGSGLAIKEDGTLWGWGGNSARLVGPTSTQVVNYPTQNGTASNWSYLSVGAVHAMGLKNNGTLWSWGANAYGVNGNGNNNYNPQPVGTASWQSIASGMYHVLGIKSDGTLWAWGRNNFNQLGDGTTVSRSAPVQIGTDNTWVSVGCGGYHSMALKTDGSLWAWGNNVFGQIGDGTTVNVPTPLYIPISDCSLSISDYQQVPLVISPNPAQEKVKLHLQNGLENVTIELYDIQGKLVLSQKQQNSHEIEINLALMNSGVYIVKVLQDQKIISQQKLIKK